MKKAYELPRHPRRQLVESPQTGLQKAGELNWGAIMRSARNPFGTTLDGFAHPMATVLLVPTKDEASSPVNTDIDIEGLILHLHIEMGTCIVLAEGDAAGVTLQDFLYYFHDGAGV